MPVPRGQKSRSRTAATPCPIGGFDEFLPHVRSGRFNDNARNCESGLSRAVRLPQFQTGTSRDVIETISCGWLGLRHAVLAAAARPRFAAALPAISGRDLLIGKQQDGGPDGP